MELIQVEELAEMVEDLMNITDGEIGEISTTHQILLLLMSHLLKGTESTR